MRLAVLWFVYLDSYRKFNFHEFFCIYIQYGIFLKRKWFYNFRPGQEKQPKKSQIQGRNQGGWPDDLPPPPLWKNFIYNQLFQFWKFLDKIWKALQKCSEKFILKKLMEIFFITPLKFENFVKKLLNIKIWGKN